MRGVGFAKCLDAIISPFGYCCKTRQQLQAEQLPGLRRSQVDRDIERLSPQVLLFVLPGVERVQRSEIFEISRNIIVITSNDLQVFIPVLFPRAPDGGGIFLIADIQPADLRNPKTAKEEIAKLVMAILTNLDISPDYRVGLNDFLDFLDGVFNSEPKEFFSWVPQQ